MSTLSIGCARSIEKKEVAFEFIVRKFVGRSDSVNLGVATHETAFKLR